MSYRALIERLFRSGVWGDRGSSGSKGREDVVYCRLFSLLRDDMWKELVEGTAAEKTVDKILCFMRVEVLKKAISKSLW